MYQKNYLLLITDQAAELALCVEFAQELNEEYIFPEIG
jgi:hypothetical protein